MLSHMAHPTLVWVNVWHADPGLRPPGGGWTGAIALRSIVPCRRPTKTGAVGQWRRYRLYCQYQETLARKPLNWIVRRKNHAEGAIRYAH